MFEEKVREVFGWIDCYSENEATKEITFEARSVSFDAEKLWELSDLLGTGKIGIETETRNDGYCETCSYEYGVMVFTATGVKF